jgi:hypothetical protein
MTDPLKDLMEEIEEAARELHVALNRRYQPVWRAPLDRFDRGNGLTRKNPLTGEPEVGIGTRPVTGAQLAQNSRELAARVSALVAKAEELRERAEGEALLLG